MIGIPLPLAPVWSHLIEANAGRAVWRKRLAWWPVPVLALVVLFSARAQVSMLRTAGPVLLKVPPVCLA
jgi:hypothetical protein